MRANSKSSALVAILAATGFLAQASVVSARPFCSSDVSDQNCRDDLVVNHWLSRRGHQPRAFRLPPGKRPGGGDDSPDVPTTPGGPSGPAKPKDGDDEQSGPVSGTPFGHNRPSNPPTTEPPESFDLSTIPNIETKGYTLERTNDFQGQPTYNILSRKNPSDPAEHPYLAAIIRTDPPRGSITVEIAFLKENPALSLPGDPKGPADRARLWEMQATIAFHKSGMRPRDIRELRAVMIEERRSVDVIEASRAKLGKGPGEDFTVRRDAGGGGEGGF